MSVYKQVRKGWLKQLTKEQRKQFKSHMQDVADSMLEAYAESIRLANKKIVYHKDETRFLPIDETGLDIRICIKIQPR